jgi:hypothetical protein
LSEREKESAASRRAERGLRRVKRGFFLRYATKAPLRVERRRVEKAFGWVEKG